MISYKLLVGISPSSRSQRDHTWSNKHFGRHFVSCLWNV